MSAFDARNKLGAAIALALYWPDASAIDKVAEFRIGAWREYGLVM